MSSYLPGSKLRMPSAATVLMLLTIMVVCFIYLLVRNFGLFLSVPDEWEYSEAARLLPLRAAGFPSYLYLWIFRVTNFCGSGFLECARLINGIFFVCAAPFIYIFARKMGTRFTALFITFLVMFSPINTYTAYFMPESFYFLLFWIFSWCALWSMEVRPSFYGGVLGIVLGLMGLVKVHAIFLTPVVITFIMFRCLFSGVENPIRRIVTTLTAFLCAAILVRFGLGYLLAGRAGLNMFGALYGSIATSAVDSSHYMHLALEAGVSLEGHIMALASLFAMPLAAMFYIRARTPGKADLDMKSRDIKLFTFLVLACLLVVTTVFTAKAAGSNAYETIARLHMRYYNFALPLLLIVAAEWLGRTRAQRALYRVLPPVIAVGILSIFAIIGLLHSYTPGIVDSPELRGLTTNYTIFSGIALAGLLALAAWVFDARIGAKIFIFIVFPLFVIFSSYYTNVELRQRMVLDSYAEAGIIAKQYIGQHPQPIITVGADASSLYRTMFYLDNASATSLVVPEGGQIAASNIPADARWLLVVGDQALPKGARQKIGFGGFVLARVGNEEEKDLDFTVGSWPGIIAGTQGLSSPEPWGTWSDGNRVVFEFSKPLPKEFTLVLKGHTIGNTDQPFTIVVGGERREIRLPSPQILTLPFKTDGNINSISIEIPWARSMREMGVSQDPRRLGIGFVSMRIISKVPRVNP